MEHNLCEHLPRMVPAKNKMHLCPWEFWIQECQNLVPSLLAPKFVPKINTT
ncbi:hypothetical protein HanXRQr2_Chr09g0391861 [Helianthus annuus]|uniref:Uncharacterized protein n=1 Tax=Helianthus annuus TaxID=4232 RepID=A0A9K3I7B8_HELAN|nr:hypothetical protein HanXRQr2_Chr09g0391861 [Helianthus annuus]